MGYRHSICGEGIYHMCSGFGGEHRTLHCICYAIMLSIAQMEIMHVVF